MLKTTNTLTAFSATALITFGCAENNTNQQSQQSIQDAVVVVEPQSQPLPIWESHLEPYGFVSSEGAVAYETYVLDAYQDHPEDADDYYDIIGNSCSWYCGGEANNVTASSTRPDEGSNTYKANNAHDLRYDTAWVEGVDGPGLGETLTYTFTNKCPRITGILIHTGYIKTR